MTAYSVVVDAESAGVAPPAGGVSLAEWLDTYISAPIRRRVILLACVAWGGVYVWLGVSVMAAGAGALVYGTLLGLFVCLRRIQPGCRMFLPEMQGHGVASAAGLLYWGIGWVFPANVATAVGLQPVWSHRHDLAIIVLAIAVVAWSIYSLVIEPNWIVVRSYHLVYSGLPAALDGFRIVHISDTHWRRPGRLVSRVIERINSLQPDLVCVTGDLADGAAHISRTSAQAVGEFFRGLDARYGTFVVLGDWDGLARNWPVVEQAIAENRTVHVLNDAIRIVKHQGADVVILGRAPGHLGANRDYMAQLPKVGFSIVLHHYPFGAIRASELGASLYLAGHTHGGQVRVPGHGTLFGSARGGTDLRGETLPPRFNRGSHRLDNTWVHISSGLGTRGGDAPPIRFGCRPEIVLLTLATAKAIQLSQEVLHVPV